MSAQTDLSRFQQLAFHHSISMVCVEDAKDLSDKVGWDPIISIVENLEKENAERALSKKPEIKVASAFRKALRELKNHHFKQAVQKKQDEEWQKHCKEVEEQKAAGFDPTTDKLWSMLGDSPEEMIGKNFLIVLQQYQIAKAESA